MPREDFVLWWEYPEYASVNERRFERYIDCKNLDYPKPGAYELLGDANEQ